MQILGQKSRLSSIETRSFPMKRRGTPVVTAPSDRLDLVEICHEHRHIPTLGRTRIDKYQRAVLLPKSINPQEIVNVAVPT